ncbi:MAG: SDR family NAD(P)-dependent oxidoreductase [Caldilineaceae bacterium]|nr:SDR family NAD(P)-dependent oxidoreductase [Caldilineaceae bacterium]MBP8106376.1 SDR family NAD(P)-dependent oxidoreductase [Caldilineaceae bacterium]MBP8121441.1 SDR family NAD(P)-dependent oxidoreductase [Caldilineaceae bacterium]MBP9073696.1 SDR family NAD(P)-dependent oxidoreductase [Caldilineaceae bacterium]
MRYDLKDKIVMVTGANAGIGKAAAIQLAQAGAQVMMMCRSAERGAIALAEVRRAANSDKVELLQVDMADQSSVRRAVDEFRSRRDRLGVLIHNAATFDLTVKKPVPTADGMETVFATNHVNIFLMTQLLLETLKASAPSRIITVASKGLITYPFLDVDFDNLAGEKKFSTQHAYYQSKQAQVMFTFDLAERLRGTGVTVNCVRVGNVIIPDNRLPKVPGWMLKIYRLKSKFAMTPEKMAETYTWLAADPALVDVTGGYWDAPNVAVKANKNAYNKETWRKLWDTTQKLASFS